MSVEHERQGGRSSDARTGMTTEPFAPGPARPTMRCLREDLSNEWDDVAQYRTVHENLPIPGHLHDLAHPVLRHAASVWPAGGTSTEKRESISGLTDPPFWKLKTGRWRGAVYVDPATGQPWVVAAGLREDGSAQDFYRLFMTNATTRLHELLPTEEDAARLALESIEADFSRWETDVRDAVASAMTRAATTGRESFDVTTVDKSRSVMGVTIEIEIVPDETDEGSVADVVVTTRRIDWAAMALADHAELVVLAAINPDEQAWDASHTGTDQLYSFMTSKAEFQDLLLTTGTREPGETHAGTTAHRTHKDRLTEKVVTGEATRAMCGVWFVPRQDPVGLSECERCADVHRYLKALANG